MWTFFFIGKITGRDDNMATFNELRKLADDSCNMTTEDYLRYQRIISEFESGQEPFEVMTLRELLPGLLNHPLDIPKLIFWHIKNFFCVTDLAYMYLATNILIESADEIQGLESLINGNYRCRPVLCQLGRMYKQNNFGKDSVIKAANLAIQAKLNDMPVGYIEKYIRQVRFFNDWRMLHYAATGEYWNEVDGA